MKRTLPPLNGLRAFEAAARHMSFTDAADELSVTQAAISHQVRGLEQRLGLKLFVRRNRSLLLSEAGQAHLPAVRAAFDQLNEATEKLLQKDRGGHLTVTTTSSFAVKWLVPRMSHFQDRNPGIDLRISAKEHLADFARDGIDISIRFGAGNWPGVRAEWLIDEAIAPVCCPALLADLQHPRDLARVTLLHEEMVPLRDFPGWETWLAAVGVGGIDPTRGPRFSHTHLMLQAAMDGRGVAMGPLLIAADDLLARRLAQPFSFKLSTGFSYYLVYPPATADRPKIRAFREWIAEEMGQHREEIASAKAIAD